MFPQSSDGVAAEPELVVPTVDIDGFCADPTSREAVEECRRIADGLHRFGVLIVRDSRVTEADNARSVASAAG